MQQDLGDSHLKQGSILATILRHDSKQTSYKIALLRAINDVALSFPDVSASSANGASVAVPLRLLAGYWIAYYWPFAHPTTPIYQGARAIRGGVERNDLSFRPSLTQLRREWESVVGAVGSTPQSAADGFLLSGEMRLPRKRAGYPKPLVDAYDAAIREISQALLQPIQYAGVGQWQVFARPRSWSELEAGDEAVVAVPGTNPRDRCLVVPSSLWQIFGELSLWVEALCIHEWCLFTEGVAQSGDLKWDRGDYYRLLTQHPESRRPLTFERNEVQILLLEGQEFTCPWTARKISGEGADYDLDHIVPLAIYPINELWNLVPADPHFNSHKKGVKLPSPEALKRALPHLATTYSSYGRSKKLKHALEEDVTVRFLPGASGSGSSALLDGIAVAEHAAGFVRHLASQRNLAVF